MPPMAGSYPTLAHADLKGKIVLLRAGFDVPIKDGNVEDASRIEALMPTMRHILESGASLIIMAHQGRPQGKADPAFTQKPIVEVLSRLLKKDVLFAESCTGPAATKAAEGLKPGDVLLLENLRYDPREEKNDLSFAKELASLGDVYVNDAFTNCHRAHASMVGVATLLPSYMGLQLEQEVSNLSRIIEDPRRPITLIVSGAKMETKVPVIQNFLGLGDDVLLGGAIANTFIAARGFDIGTSLCEEEFLEQAQEIMLESEKEGKAKICIPRDAVVATEASEDAQKLDLPLEDIGGDMKILDIGKITLDRYINVIRASGMIVWNGPLGLYELNRFSHATKRIAEAIAEATKAGAVSIVGGGDTLDFHARYGYDLSAYSFVSTGGGAMLEFIAGAPLPALEVLKATA
jgi:3-phosphoglycerate kinase